MHVQILRDSQGNVIAIFERTAGALASTEPQVSEGQYLEEVEAPDNYADDLDAFYKECSESKRQQ